MCLPPLSGLRAPAQLWVICVLPEALPHSSLPAKQRIPSKSLQVGFLVWLTPSPALQRQLRVPSRAFRGFWSCAFSFPVVQRWQLLGFQFLLGPSTPWRARLLHPGAITAPGLPELPPRLPAVLQDSHPHSFQNYFWESILSFGAVLM